MCLPHGGESSDLPCYQLPFSNTCLWDGQHHRHTALNRGKETSLRGRVLSASFETNMSLSQLKLAKQRPIKIEPTETFFVTVCDFVMEVTESFARPFPDVKQTLQPSLPLSVPYCIILHSTCFPLYRLSHPQSSSLQYLSTIHQCIKHHNCHLSSLSPGPLCRLCNALSKVPCFDKIWVGIDFYKCVKNRCKSALTLKPKLRMSVMF